MSFEDLVSNPVRVLSDIGDDLRLPFTDAMLQYYTRATARLEEHRDRRRADGTLLISHAGRVEQQALTRQPLQQSRVEAWKNHMDAAEQARFVAVAGDLLAALGYAT